MYEYSYGYRHYRWYLLFHAIAVRRFLPMNSFFISKNGDLIAKIRTIVHAAIVLCLSLKSLKSTSAANTHKALNESEQLACQCAASLRGKKCHQHKKTTSHFLTSPRPISSATCWEETGAHFGIEPSLLKAIALKESRGRPNAVVSHERSVSAKLTPIQLCGYYPKKKR